MPILVPMADLTSENAALRARVAALEGDAARRKSLGRPPQPATSPDGRLIARVCRRLGIRRRELAERLGVAAPLLSRVNGADGHPLAERHRVAMRAMLAAAEGEPASPSSEAG